MAIDSRNKRGSILGLGLAVLLPLADGAINNFDRLQVAHLYSGISVVAGGDTDIDTITAAKIGSRSIQSASDTYSASSIETITIRSVS